MNFLQDYERLKKSIPVPAIVVTDNEDCEHVDYCHYCKNCHYCIQLSESKDCLYCAYGAGTDMVDCLFGVFCELCYECVDSMKCYASTYLQNCTNCRNCHFSSHLVDCEDCFGCVAISHKKYCLFNKQLTKEKYLTEVNKLKMQPVGAHLAKLAELNKLIPQPACLQRNNVNCPYGDNLNNSKDVYWGFDTYYLENSGYIFMGGVAKDCWDMAFAGGVKGVKSEANISMGGAMELCYELSGAGPCYHCFYLEQVTHCTDCYHSAYLRNCTDCFGCVGLSNKKYCFLNNQLTKEQYEQATAMVKKELGWRVD